MCVVFDVVDGNRLVALWTAHLIDRLTDVVHQGDLLTKPAEADDDHDVEAAPVLLWNVEASGQTVALSDSAPHLSSTAWSRSGEPRTASLGGVLVSA